MVMVCRNAFSAFRQTAIMIAWRGHQLLQQQRDVISWAHVKEVRYNDRLDFDMYSI